MSEGKRFCVADAPIGLVGGMVFVLQQMIEAGKADSIEFEIGSAKYLFCKGEKFNRTVPLLFCVWEEGGWVITDSSRLFTDWRSS